MYYESVIHTEKKVADAAEAAKLLKSGQVIHYEAVTFINPADGKQYYIVNDMDCNSSAFYEAAIIRKDDQQYTQIESFTIGWMTEETLLNDLNKLHTYNFMNSKASLIFDKAPENAVAWFTCGCCGNGFKGNVKYQLAFDQDSGYGICKSCEKYYK